MAHNHSFCQQDLVHHIRSQRSISKEETKYLAHLKQKGIGVADGYRCSKVEAGGSPALVFTLKDAYNAVAEEILKKLDGCDTNTLINIFRQRESNEDDFYWDMEMDLDSSIISFFWRDKQMKEDYMAFGDVVIFYTTYRTNTYGLICAPFVGINRHGHNVMFGCGFLKNETTDSFIWLFNTFLKSMDGLYPKTIMTDQAQAMANGE